MRLRAPRAWPCPTAYAHAACARRTRSRDGCLQCAQPQGGASSGRARRGSARRRAVVSVTRRGRRGMPASPSAVAGSRPSPRGGRCRCRAATAPGNPPEARRRQRPSRRGRFARRSGSPLPRRASTSPPGSGAGRTRAASSPTTRRRSPAAPRASPPRRRVRSRTGDSSSRSRSCRSSRLQSGSRPQQSSESRSATTLATARSASLPSRISARTDTARAVRSAAGSSTPT